MKSLGGISEKIIENSSRLSLIATESTPYGDDAKVMLLYHPQFISFSYFENTIGNI